MRYVITRVLPLPAPARINTGPSTVSTASRCCGFSCERNVRRTAPEPPGIRTALVRFYRTCGGELCRPCGTRDRCRLFPGTDVPGYLYFVGVRFLCVCSR